MANYDFDYALWMLRQAIDFAEIEHEFMPLRKWAQIAERSVQEMEEVENRLNLPASQNVLLATLQSVATGLMPPDEAVQQIRSWLVTGQIPMVKSELVSQNQFA